MIQGVVDLPLVNSEVVYCPVKIGIRDQSRSEGGGAMMNTYEVLTLLILNNTFIVALLSYLDNRNNKHK